MQQSAKRMQWIVIACCKGKVKVNVDLYIAPHRENHTLRRLGVDHTVLHASTLYLSSPRSVHQRAPLLCVVIAAIWLLLILLQPHPPADSGMGQSGLSMGLGPPAVKDFLPPALDLAPKRKSWIRQWPHPENVIRDVLIYLISLWRNKDSHCTFHVSVHYRPDVQNIQIRSRCTVVCSTSNLQIAITLIFILCENYCDTLTLT